MTNIVLLDGGMGQELIRRSSQPPSPLWSAQVMMDEPHIVEAVHRTYIEAGAKVLTLNTYSATPERLERDASADLFEPLQLKARDIALSAKGDTDTVIGGCLSPLYGSYHPESAPTFDVCLKAYRVVAKTQASHCDVLICETLASVKEVSAAVQAGVETGLPVWCGMTTVDADGTSLRSGEPLSEGVKAAVEAGATAVAVNCSWPEAVTQAIPILKASGLPFGGWANGFTKADDLKLGGTVDALSTRTDLDPVGYTKHAMAWIEQGATLVGGCCEVGPDHIAHLATSIRNAGHEIVGNL